MRAALALTLLVLTADPITWSDGPPLPVGRDHHVTFLVPPARGGAVLYVAGGNTYQGVLADVWHAAIGADGTLGAWTAGDSLPGGRAGHSVAVTERSVIITGGKLADRKNTTATLTASIVPDGTLGPWRAATPLPTPRFHHASVSIHGMVYVLGGLEENVSVASVVGAPVGADGAPGAWRELTALPRPRSHHAAFVHDGALWVVAGLDGNPAGQNTPLADVLRAPIGADGSLGAWTEVSRLDSALAVFAAVVHDGYVYVLGGVENNARFVNTVQRAPLLAGGRLGAWERLASGLPTARAHVHQTPVYRGRIYSAGGSASRQVTTAVHVGTFAP